MLMNSPILLAPSLTIEASNQVFAVMERNIVYVGTNPASSKFATTVVRYSHPGSFGITLRPHHEGVWLASFTGNVRLEGPGPRFADFSGYERPPHGRWVVLSVGAHAFQFGEDPQAREEIVVNVYERSEANVTFLHSGKMPELCSKEQVRKMSREKTG